MIDLDVILCGGSLEINTLPSYAAITLLRQIRLCDTKVFSLPHFKSDENTISDRYPAGSARITSAGRNSSTVNNKFEI